LERSVALDRLVLAVVSLLTVWGIWSFGIWDPWELDAADAARTLSETVRSPSTHVAPSTRLIAAAFGTFGIREWSGRLPGVIAALLSCALTFVLLRNRCGRRTGAIGVAVIASTPLFLLNARLLMGAAVEVFAQTWVGLAALAVSSSRRTSKRAFGGYVFLGLGLALSSDASGVLLGPLPPILAVGALGLLSEDTGRGSRLARWLVPAIAAALLLGVARAVSLDDAGFSIWLGGGALGGNPPTFDKAVELIFHGFAPWSAALPVAAIWVLTPRPRRSESAQNLGWMLLLWVAFEFVSWTVFASRYGTPPYLALVPLAGLIAIWISEVSREPVARWPAAVVVALLLGLLIRDYALYPNSPLSALGIDGLEVPDAYHPTARWALVLGVNAALLCLMLLSHERIARPKASAAVRWIRAEWSLGGARRVWLVLASLLLTACVVFGLMCFALDLGIASLALRLGRALFFIPFVLAGLLWGLPWLRYAYGRLGNRRMYPVLGGGLLLGSFVALSFQPALGQHFSPKPVYEAYTELSGGEPEPLATYKLPSTAARYYSNAPVEEIDRQTDLFNFLTEGGQRWAVIKADSLPGLNRAYRRKTGEHLFIADATSSRLLLVAARAIDGRANQSFIAAALLDADPASQHPVGANFDDRIELVGYDLELPGDDSVGAGQRFEISWYWRVIGDAPAGYQVFVHIDGFGRRLNGDHVPVGGRYPTKLWDEGDLIADAQELRVPANYPGGDYAIYVGLFSGSKRLELKSGANDGENRLNVGTLRVR
jgi:4-amino-4-deoxy-L-arabinose transferase-like glycosyltransferase